MLGKRPSRTVEDQLNVLGDCGIAPNSGVALHHLLESFSREDFESEPFMLLLCVLGGECEGSARTESGYLSDHIWHFDTECIEDHGDYSAIANRMSALAQGALPLLDVRDFVDIEGNEAWIEFEHRGQAHHWPAQVQDDWVDPTILSRFALLLDELRCGRRFTYVDCGGQDCLIGCSTPEQREMLRRETGLDVDWLT